MSIERLRENIDSLDAQLVKLLNKRALLTQKIGQHKRETGKMVYVPDREKEVLDRIASLNTGPMSRTSLEAIYAEIMSSSLSLEKGVSIAYLGPEWTFTHQASVKKFGSSVNYIPCHSVSDIFTEVENGRCDYGVAPVENSTEGAIYHTLDKFIDSDLKICSEILLKISLHLLSKENHLDSIRTIYSKAEAFGQCRQWIETHLPKAQLEAVPSTAFGAEKASQSPHSACIASKLVANSLGLRVVVPDIQDNSNNVTRFLVLCKEYAKPTGKDKTSLVISIQDQPGALKKVLEPLYKLSLNLTKIESRPSKRKNWEYFFFIDLDGHIDQPKIKKALLQIQKVCSFVKILGSYPISNSIK